MRDGTPDPVLRALFIAVGAVFQGVIAAVAVYLVLASGESEGRIYFSSNRDGNLQVFSMRPDGSNVRRLTDTAACDDGSPVVSPDGRFVAFDRFCAGSDFQVWLMDRNGGHARRVTGDGVIGHGPAWSPDGRTIAFVSRAGTRQDIYLINPDGRDLRRLVATPGDDDRPSWSPDGRWIVFSSLELIAGVGPARLLYVVNRDGEDLYDLTSPDYDAGQPAWSPDGHTIAFVGGVQDPRIFLIDAGGANLRPLTPVGTAAVLPVWSPDGRHVAFTSDRREARPDDEVELTAQEICVIDVDGANLRRLTDNPAIDFINDWR